MQICKGRAIILYKLRKLFLFILCIAIVLAVVANADGVKFSAQALYNSKTMVKDINTRLYEYAEKNPSYVYVTKVGESYHNQDILTIKIGNGKKHIFINAAHHGKEYMTSILAMNQIDYLINKYKSDKEIQELLDEVSVVFLPVVNPDGVEISRGFLKPIGNIPVSNKTSISNIYAHWKANGEGVDLNRNYPMRWEYILGDPGRPYSKNYKGPKPFSEIETQIVRDLCKEYDFEVVIAYHSAGEVIFWYGYQDKEVEKRDYIIAKNISKITGYRIDEVRSTAGGMKDWFVQKYKKPGFTLEIGSPRYVGEYIQLPYSEYSKVWNQNKDVPEYLLKLVRDELNLTPNPNSNNEEVKNIISIVKRCKSEENIVKLSSILYNVLKYILPI